MAQPRVRIQVKGVRHMVKGMPAPGLVKADEARVRYERSTAASKWAC